MVSSVIAFACGGLRICTQEQPIYFGPISILAKLDQVSQFQVTIGEVGMLEVHAAVEVQLATCICRLLLLLKLRKLSLICLMGFLSRDV